MKEWLWSLRRQVSFLIDHGHSDAALYPIGFLTDEASIVAQRLNDETASKALLTQSILATIPNMATKPQSVQQAQTSFRRFIDKLMGK